MGRGDELLKMLGTAKDDHTRVEAFKALLALAESDKVVENQHKARATSLLMSISNSSEDSEYMTYKYKLLRRFQDLKYDIWNLLVRGQSQGMRREIPKSPFGSNELRKQKEARRKLITRRQALRDEAWGAN
ncbi:hypothetical protein Sjap_005696 [Stephania japonica]|uniref:Uncharacterized protein n=1 Tax=Stephania japonica TaxID=461633 RepID=A0AAP0PI87_9MAGN